MPTYDPQRTRNRPTPSADDPAPVDAFLDAVTEITMLPEGVDIEVTPGGETIVHTADADISITPAGDDVVVATRDAIVEVRAELDEVIVDTAGEEIYIDTAPRAPLGTAGWSETPIVRSDGGRSKLALAVVAALAALVAVLVVSRRRR
ncbi:MAG: hypothetical protein WCJ88_04090 [Actinomycetes bacterium]